MGQKVLAASVSARLAQNTSIKRRHGARSIAAWSRSANRRVPGGLVMPGSNKSLWGALKLTRSRSDPRAHLIPWMLVLFLSPEKLRIKKLKSFLQSSQIRGVST